MSSEKEHAQMCDFAECSNIKGPFVKGFCPGHYAQIKRGKDLKPLRKVRALRSASDLECSFENCFRPINYKDLCRSHRSQQLRGEELKPLNDKYWNNRQFLNARVNEEGQELCLYCSRWLDWSYFGKYGDMCNRCRQLARYSITYEDFQNMLKAQNYKCAGCCRSQNSHTGTFHIDHDHSCCAKPSRSCGNCIRGLLCSFCNRALGLVKDDIQILSNLIFYLENGV